MVKLTRKLKFDSNSNWTKTPRGAVSGVNRAVSDSRVPHYVWVRTKRSYRYSVPSAIGLRYIWLNQTACKWNKYPMWPGHVSANTSNNAFQNFLGLRFLSCSASYFSDMLICMILNKRWCFIYTMKPKVEIFKQLWDEVQVGDKLHISVALSANLCFLLKK